MSTGLSQWDWDSLPVSLATSITSYIIMLACEGGSVHRGAAATTEALKRGLLSLERSRKRLRTKQQTLHGMSEASLIGASSNCCLQTLEKEALTSANDRCFEEKSMLSSLTSSSEISRDTIASLAVWKWHCNKRANGSSKLGQVLYTSIQPPP